MAAVALGSTPRRRASLSDLVGPASRRLDPSVDIAYPSKRVVVELDGFGPHSGAEAFQRDRARQNRLVLLGWTVLRFTWRDVTAHPDQVVAVVRQALAA